MKIFVLFLALVTFLVLVGVTQDAESRGMGARYWYVKYHKEKRTTKRLRKQLGHVRSGRNQLQGEIMPWVRLSMCESGGRWAVRTGNGFFGGLQFRQDTWRSFGGRIFASSAHRATAIQQAAIAQKVLARQGRGAWPGCTRKKAW